MGRRQPEKLSQKSKYQKRGKPEVLKLMRENHRTRVTIIFNCGVVREEIFNENVNF